MSQIPTRRKALVAAMLASAALVGGASGAAVTMIVRDTAPAVAVADGAVRPVAFRPNEGSLPDMLRSVLPAVVQLQVRETAPSGLVAPSGGPMGDLFHQFFGDTGPVDGPPVVGEALGSGFIISSDGLIVTNDHVIDGADKMTVKLADGRELPATLVGRDPKTDLAVVRVKADGLPSLRWGDSEALRIGDDVLAVGSPFGLGGTVTRGIVSGRSRRIGSGPYDDFIQVDAAINQGNSGGPLLDGTGRVVGINAALYSPSGGNVGIGFAIPAALARSVVEQLVSQGAVARGQIGVSVQDVTPDIADSLGKPALKGALIANLVSGSPAERAGLKPGDIITKFAGHAITDAHDLSTAVAGTPAGTHASVHLLRAGGETDLKVDVAPMPGSTPKLRRTAYDAPVDKGTVTVLGLTVQPATPELNREIGQPDDARGAIVAKIDPTSDSATRDLQPGDLIRAVNNVEIGSPRALAADVEAARRAGRHNVLLTVQRGDDRAFIAVPLA